MTNHYYEALFMFSDLPAQQQQQQPCQQPQFQPPPPEHAPQEQRGLGRGQSRELFALLSEA